MTKIELLEAIIEEMEETSMWGIKAVVDESDVEGDGDAEKQESESGKFEYIYVEQHQRFEDCFYGFIYLPFFEDGNKKCIKCWYED